MIAFRPQALLCLLLVCLLSLPVLSHGASPVSSVADADNPRDPSVTYKMIGGVAMSRPCCVSTGPSRIDCLIRGEESTVLQWWKENGKPQQEWVDIGGSVVGDLECVSRTPGNIDLLVRWADNALYSRAYSGSWGEWSIREGETIMEAPVCVARQSTVINCVVRNKNSVAYIIGAVDNGWTGFSGFGGPFSQPLMISRRSDTALDYFGTMVLNRLYVRRWIQSIRLWPWQFTGSNTSLQSQPLVFGIDSSTFEVFALGTKNQLLYRRWAGGTWDPEYEDLGGSFMERPTCLNLGADLYCFGVGPKSQMCRKSRIDGTWTEWLCTSGKFIGSPSCVVSNEAEKEITCYARGFAREVVELTYKL